MSKKWWMALALVSMAGAWGCSGGKLIPNDIEKLMGSEGGRWALKAIEGHGGIWRWRQRPFASFDYMLFASRSGMDTLIESRNRDTTITPRIDTLVNLREHVVVDLHGGRFYAESKAQSPFVQKGYDGRSDWMALDGQPSMDPIELAGLEAHRTSIIFDFALPFVLLDTTAQFELTGDEPTVDTVIAKGKDPGTFDTTLTEYTLKKLRVTFSGGRAPGSGFMFYLDERDGRIRRMLWKPSGGLLIGQTYLTVLSEIERPLGLQIGGRRASYPADDNGRVTGPLALDERIYNVDLPRELTGDPFTWTARRGSIMKEAAQTP
jgi:hypothetical protein